MTSGNYLVFMVRRSILPFTIALCMLAVQSESKIILKSLNTGIHTVNRIVTSYTKSGNLNARNAKRELLKLCFIDDVKVSQDGDDTILTFTEYPTIRHVTYEIIDEFPILGRKKKEAKGLPTHKVSKNIFPSKGGLGDGKIPNPLHQHNIKTGSRLIDKNASISAALVANYYKSKGYINAKANVKIVPLPQNAVDVVFEVTLGNFAPVRDIVIDGCDKINRGRLLTQMKTKKRSLVVAVKKIIFGSSESYIYNQDALGKDLLKVIEYCKNHGYMDAKIKSCRAEYSPSIRGVVVHISIDSGKLYKYRDVYIDVANSVENSCEDSINNLRKEDVQKINKLVLKNQRKILRLKPGKTYDQSSVDYIANEIRKVMVKNRIFANVDVEVTKSDSVNCVMQNTEDEKAISNGVISRYRAGGIANGKNQNKDDNPEECSVSVRFKVAPSPPSSIHSVRISGNEVTKETVILKKIGQSPGDMIFDKELEKLSIKNTLMHSGLFKSVNIEMGRDGAINVPIGITVKEGPTTMARAELGYEGGGISKGLHFIVSYTNPNIAGTGNLFSASAGAALKSIGAELQYEHGISGFGRANWSLSSGLSSAVKKEEPKEDAEKKKIYKSYKEVFLSFGPSISYPISSYLSHLVGVKFSLQGFTKIKDYQSPYTKVMQGYRYRPIFENNFTFDYFDPWSKINTILELKTSYAAFKGQNLRNEIKASFETPIGDTPLSLYGAVYGGHVLGGKDLYPYDQFSLGGPGGRYSIPGIVKQGIGPRDGTTLESVGGSFYAKIYGELRLKLPIETEFFYQYPISVFAFITAGGVGSSAIAEIPENPIDSNAFSVSASAGLGLTWQSPFANISIGIPFVIRKGDGLATTMFAFCLEKRF